MTQPQVPARFANLEGQAQAQTSMPGYQDPDLHIPGQGPVKQGVSVFLYGGVGTWKTSWAGTWPRPIFLSVGPEGGDDALAMLPSLYNIQAPPSYHITSPKMMLEKVERIARDYRAMNINTVVVDSVTYYVDMWVAELMEFRYKDPKIRERIEKAGGEATNMTMRDWGLLAMHVRDLAMKLHKTQLNVIWIALERELKENDEQRGTSRVIAVEPYIRGEMTIKLPGMCKMIIHAHKDLKPDPQVMGRMMAQPVYYTSPNFLTKTVRHKYGNAFQEGRLITPAYGEVPASDIPSFNAIWSRIGQFVYYTQ